MWGKGERGDKMAKTKNKDFSKRTKEIIAYLFLVIGILFLVLLLLRIVRVI